MRVTGGQLAGRRLRAPRGGDVRPTSDRVRESLFARLGDLSGQRVLDLFSGSGALAIEALSRGAAHVVLVERAAPALACLEGNLTALGLEGRSRVLRAAVRSALPRLAREGRRFDLVFLDPPYASDAAEGALRGLVEHGLLAAEALVVLESGRRQAVPRVEGLASLDERRYGDTLIRRFVPAGPGGAGAGGDDAGPEAETGGCESG